MPSNQRQPQQVQKIKRSYGFVLSIPIPTVLVSSYKFWPTVTADPKSVKYI